MDSDRRDFLKRIGGITAAVAAGAACDVAPEALQAAGLDPAAVATSSDAGLRVRASTTGPVALELEGAPAGWVSSVEGGEATAAVVIEQPGPGSPFPRKHIGGVGYEDLVITCATGMTEEFYSWLHDAMNGQFRARDGAIVEYDRNLREVRRLEFHQGLVTQLALPALNAGAQTPGSLRVVITPEYSRKEAGRRAAAKAGPAKTPRWVVSNFRLTIPGLESALAAVTTVGAMTTKFILGPDLTGPFRDYTRPARVEVPNLVFAVAESRADSVVAWHEDFVIQGNSEDAKERSGTL
ncbi:MAG TPA: hypothetical protein VLQ79_00770, partial [Myxococcaceae bacterium]|nr:hypothetical protein [Myxococcaceae bacterium]